MSVALNPAITPTYLLGTAPDMLAAGRAGELLPAAGHPADSSRMPRSLDDLLVGAVQRAGATTQQQMAAIQAVMPVPELFDEGERNDQPAESPRRLQHCGFAAKRARP
jgi:hypothetical protein